MKKLLPLLFTLFFLTQLSGKEIKISSYNVENLFDLETTGGEYPIYRKGSNNWNIDTYLKKLNNIATVISAINADIIALQEVESQKALNDLNNTLRHHKSGYKYKVFGKNGERTNTATCLLSRHPIIRSFTHKVNLEGKSFTRPILQATVLIDEKELIVFVVHWPSKRGKESKRVTTAKKVMEIVNGLLPNSEYIILGDFNSDYDEAQNLLSDDLDNSGGVSGFSHILKTATSEVGKEFKVASAGDVLNGDATHYSPWVEIKEQNRYSYIYKGEKNAIDHILFPVSLLDNNNFSYKANSFSCFNFNGKLTLNRVPFRWQMIGGWGKREHIGKGYSDHLPITATLLLDEINSSPYLNPKVVTGSFESTQDGWIVADSKYRANRVIDSSLEGSYSLNVRGKSKSNVTVLKVTGVVSQTPISFFIKGTGTVSIRYRKSGEKWSYRIGDDKISKGANGSYTPVEPNWKEIVINNSSLSIGDTISLEIRSKKETPLNLFVDKSNFNGWYRR
jgi:endonuclease/exonuclease/phosphatase family metal-dependent hydrolase